MGAFERITVEVPAEAAEALRRLVDRDGYESLDQLVTVALNEWFSIQASDERRLESLRAAVKEGQQSGPGIPAEQVFAQVRARISARQANR